MYKQKHTSVPEFKQILTALFLCILSLQASGLYGQAQSELLQQFFEVKENYRLGNVNESVASLKDLQPLLCREQLHYACTESALIKASIYRSQEEFELFKEQVDFGLRQVSERQLEHHHLHPEFYIQLSFFEGGKTNIDAAMKYEQKADSLIQHHNINGITKGRLFFLKGFNRDTQGDYKTAIENYNMALSSVASREQSLDVVALLTQVYNNMGISYRRLGDVDSAMALHQANLELVKKNYGSSHKQLTNIYNSIGSIYYTIGDYGTAADYFIQATDIVKLNYGRLHPDYAAALNNAAVCYFSMSDISRSLELFEEAQNIKEQILGPDHPETAVGYANLSALYMQNGDSEAALKNAKLSVEVRRNIFGDIHPDLISPLVQYGNILAEIGNHQEARNQFHEAALIAETSLGANHPDIWDISIKIGNSFSSENRLEEAKNHFSRAISMMTGTPPSQISTEKDLEQVSYPFLYLAAIKSLAETELNIFEQTKNINSLLRSFSLFEKAAGTIDLLQFRYKSEASKLNLIDNNYTVYSNAVKAAYYLLEQTKDPIWLDEIINYSERSRSRLALELIQRAEAKQFAGVPEQILTRENELNQKIAHHYQQLAIEQEKGNEADSLHLDQHRDSLFVLKQQLEEYTRMLEEEFPLYHQQKYSQKLVDRQHAQLMISENQTILKFIKGSDFWMAVTISQNETSVEFIDSVEGVKASVERLRESILHGDTEELKSHSRFLYTALFEPIIEQLGTESIIIIPDESLYYLPFEMLLTQEPGRDVPFNQFPFLLHKFNISYAPSITMLNHMSRERNSNPRNFLALAPFNQAINERSVELYAERSAGALSPLPLTEFETREIAGLFQQKDSFYDFLFPESADILLHKEATKENFISHELESYGFLHFATHAFINETHPDLSGIALWGEEDSGVLYVNDIYNMRFDADLAVLGACETGLGTLYRGEGVIGFTRAFIFAGVSNLAVSMWRVNDQPTSRLMISFYRNIKQGAGYSEALRAAKLELLEFPEFSNPKNWAAFVLYGY
jgi:CHAT domain-containing protein